MEQEEKEKWVNTIRESLIDYSLPPKFDGWERLEKKIPPTPVAQPKRSYIMYTAAAAVILLLIISGAVILLLDNSSAKYMETASIPAEVKLLDNKQSLKEIIKPIVKDNVSILSNSSKEIKIAGNKSQNHIANAKSTTGNNGETNRKINSSDLISQADISTPEEKEKTRVRKLDENYPKDDEAVKNNGNISQHQKENKSQQQNLRKVSKQAEQVTELRDICPRKSANRWSVGVTAGNSTGISSGESGESNQILSDPFNQQFYSLVYNKLEGNVFNSTATTQNLNHKLPVSFGLSVRKQLSKRFALESGITYTQLVSEASGNNYASYRQTLNYIGIPVKADYLFLDRRFVTLYITAGGMAEKSVSGNVRIEEHVSGNKINETSTSLNVKPLQWSISGALGAQFNVTPQFGIFAEPGVIYYFNDGSKVETIRKETPFNINLQLGLRISY